MNSTRSIAYILAGVIGAAALAGCSTPPPPPPPPPLPPVPTPPPITLSESLTQDAAAYQEYMARIAAISPEFKSGDDVAASLKAGDADDPRQLLRGSIAYAAVVALQDPAFVKEVQVFAANPVSRPLLTDDITNNPAYVVGIKSADSAAALVIATLMDQGQKLYSSGELVKQSAYSIQRQSWSQQMVANRDQRLADAKAVVPMLPTSTDAARLQQEAIGAAPMGMAPPAAPATQPYPPVVIRGLALAALAVLGEAGDDQAARTTPIVTETTTSNCLSDAKLNLYQCLAVSKPHYEDIFCLGQHVMMDTGQCMMIAAGAPPPVYAPVAHSSTEVAYVPPGAAKKKKRVKKH
ncbi:MAG TPA: hypothetical protein VHY32_09605 [Caulobacteraceae bacterium]|nr:hypothetical protein [Caulobacteraceae bacterium]